MNMIASAAFAALAAAAFGGAAEACPDSSQYGAHYLFTGSELYIPQTLTVTAGGSEALTECGFVDSGYVTSTPDFTFDLTEMSGYRLEVRVVSDCDAALLVNSPNGTWYYDDDSNGNLDPAIYLSGMSNGFLDVWVGTYDGQYCDATLTLETF